MSKGVQELKALFREISGFGAYEIMDGIVHAVNEEEALVDVAVQDGVYLYDVKLRTVSDGAQSGFICIPSVGSYVLVAKVRNASDYVLIQCSALDKVIIDTAIKVELNSDETVFNEGLHGGLVKIEELKQNLEILKNYITTMNTSVSTALATLDASAGSASSAPYNSIMSAMQINFADMENDKIKQ